MRTSPPAAPRRDGLPAGGATAVRVAPPDDNPHRLLTEEHRLIRAAQGGDRPSFAALVERYWDRLYRWLYHLTHDRHAAEDLAQETFLKAFAGLGRFRLRAGAGFSAWLFRIAHNAFADQYRSAAAGRRREALPDDLPAPPGGGPVEEAQSREAIQEVGRALGRLPAEFRAALLLRAEQGLSFREIAAVMNLTEETARWRVFKARQKLLGLLPSPLTPLPRGERGRGEGLEQEKS
jgi:RNA polymerase sigma-70 factor (ECF subfamily)